MKDILFGMVTIVLGAAGLLYGVHALKTGETRHRILHPYPLWNAPPLIARASGLLVIVLSVVLIRGGWRLLWR